MFNCIKCNKEFLLKQAKSNHEKYCDGDGTKKDKKEKIGTKSVCNLCNTLICNRQFKKHQKTCNGKGKSKQKKFPGVGSDWNKGKTYIEIFGEEKSNKIKSAISKKLTENPPTGVGSTPEIEDNRRTKIRNAVNIKYKNGWDPKCGRAKKYNYESKIAGKIKVDGLWELGVAKYLDSLNLNWRRNKERFNYINLEGNNATYKPDFYIFEWNAYLEIKGYETSLDKCKWKQFTEFLIIWKKEELKKLKII